MQSPVATRPCGAEVRQRICPWRRAEADIRDQGAQSPPSSLRGLHGQEPCPHRAGFRSQAGWCHPAPHLSSIWICHTELLASPSPLHRTLWLRRGGPATLPGAPEARQGLGGFSTQGPTPVWPCTGGQGQAQNQAVCWSVFQMKSVRSRVWNMCLPASCTRGGGGKPRWTALDHLTQEKPSGNLRPVRTMQLPVTVMTA